MDKIRSTATENGQAINQKNVPKVLPCLESITEETLRHTQDKPSGRFPTILVKINNSAGRFGYDKHIMLSYEKSDEKTELVPHLSANIGRGLQSF
jgi:hypothetical protein